MESFGTMAIVVLFAMMALTNRVSGQDGGGINCPIPAQIRNGRYTTTGRSVGSTVTYECFANYELIREKQATCLQDGSWSSLAPECQRIRCPDPTRIPNGGFPVPDPTVGNTVTYRCFPGYTLNGQATLECQPDKTWFPQLPSCTKTTCPQPRIENGQYTATSSSLTVGARVTYQCSVGYELVGNVEATCQTKGTWSSQPPTCRATGCSPPTSIANGGVVYPNTLVGSRANYHCNTGFELIGGSERVCQADGAWSPERPTCRVASCPQPADVVNGGFRVTGTTVGSRVDYQCTDGYRLVGDAQAFCQASRTWSSVTPTCVRSSTCPLPPTISNAQYTYDGVSVGSRAYYTCDEGFEIAEKETSLCLVDGTWSEPPTCRATHCPRPRRIENGILRSSTYTVGSKVHYTCRQGHRLEGQSDAICQDDGKWSTEPPVCILEELALPCQSDPCYHGVCVDLLDDYMCVCPTGYTGKNCERLISCSDPGSVDNCVIDYTSTTLGSKAVHTCDKGYEMVGGREAICQTTGHWSQQPSCAARASMNCALPRGIANGRVTYMYTGTAVGSRIIYRCSRGFRLIGSARVTCLSNGRWTAAAATCRRISSRSSSDDDNSFKSSNNRNGSSSSSSSSSED